MNAPYTTCTRCLLQATRRQQQRPRAGTLSRHASTSSSSSTSTSPKATAAPKAKSSSSDSNNMQTFHTPQGRVRVDVSRASLVGRHQSRGERPYQEDTLSVRGITLDPGELSRAMDEYAVEGWDQERMALSGATSAAAPARPPPDKAKGKEREEDDHADMGPAERSSTGKEEQAQEPEQQQEPEQAVWLSVMDGHNGSSISHYLRDNLHSAVLSARRGELDAVVGQYRALGGYMRRYKAGILEPLVEPLQRRFSNAKKQDSSEETRRKKEERDAIPWNLHQRVTASFLETDLKVMELDKEAGAVATSVIVHSLDSPRVPFFSAENLHILVAHLGDTRALLCSVPDGTAIPLTETHHPEARSETDRLMRTRTGAVTDSFGESRWGGGLANTRGFGDSHYKALGVFAEPAVHSRVVRGSEYSFLAVMSDGVTEKLSDQEIVDLIRGEGTPERGAKVLVGFAESIGASDNLTCLVVPLLGWGKATGEDTTKARRDFRAKNFEGISSRQARM